MAFTKTLQYALVAAVANGVAQSQSKGAAGNLTLNGSLVSSGVATLDSGGASRRVLFTFAGNESGHNFTVTGTDRYGRAQTEVVAGTTAGTTYTSKDFKTVTQVAVDAATTSTLTVGTNAIGSSAPWVVDQWPNPSFFGGEASLSGSATYNIEAAYDDFSPQWDLNSNTPTYFTAVDGSAGAAQQFNQQIGCTLLRLTILSGTGTVTAKMRQTYSGRAT